jgi:hypothetical protein
MRQEVFNQFIHSDMFSTEMVRAIALIHTAQRMGREIQERRAEIVLDFDGLNFRVEDFIVSKEGDLALSFYRPEKSQLDNARLYFSDDLSLTMINAWTPDPVEPTGEGEARNDRRNERQFEERDRSRNRENARGSRLRASDHLGQVEIDILRLIYHKAAGETVELLRNFWKTIHPVKIARKHNVDDIVYALGERDRLEAMFEVRVVRPGAGDFDLDLVHLLTGEPRNAHSSNYGTEQDWLKSLAVRNVRQPDLIPNDEERDFMEKARAYVKANDKK